MFICFIFILSQFWQIEWILETIVLGYTWCFDFKCEECHEDPYEKMFLRIWDFWSRRILYSVSPSSGSDVVRLFAKRSAKSRAPSEIAHVSSRKHKNKEECVHTLRSCICMLMSLPEHREKEYSNALPNTAIVIQMNLSASSLPCFIFHFIFISYFSVLFTIFRNSFCIIFWSFLTWSLTNTYYNL